MYHKLNWNKMNNRKTFYLAQGTCDGHYLCFCLTTVNGYKDIWVLPWMDSMKTGLVHKPTLTVYTLLLMWYHHRIYILENPCSYWMQLCRRFSLNPLLIKGQSICFCFFHSVNFDWYRLVQWEQFSLFCMASLLTEDSQSKGKHQYLKPLYKYIHIYSIQDKYTGMLY